MMREQYYYANFPTKLLHEEFKDAEDLKNHLSAMALIVSYVHTETGEFYLSRGVLARKLGISERKARRIIDNFINWGYIEKIEDKKGKKNIAIYKLKTYNFNLQERPTECPTKCPTERPTQIKEYQYSELQERPTECPTKCPTERPQTNNEITNNEKTNNEEEYIKEKSSLTDSNFKEIADIESQDVLYDAYLETFNHICPEKRIIAVTSERISALEKAQEILNKAGIEWKEACEKFKESEWIYSKRYATFDWFIKPDNLVKVLEGRFIDAGESDLIEKPYSLTAINRLKNHPLTKEHYETADLLNLLRRYYKRHSGDTVYIEAPHAVHLQIESIFQDLSIYFEDRGVVSCN